MINSEDNDSPIDKCITSDLYPQAIGSVTENSSGCSSFYANEDSSATQDYIDKYHVRIGQKNKKQKLKNINRNTSVSFSSMNQSPDNCSSDSSGSVLAPIVHKPKNNSKSRSPSPKNCKDKTPERKTILKYSNDSKNLLSSGNKVENSEFDCSSNIQRTTAV